MLTQGPSVISSIMGLYPPDFVARMKDRRIKWFATVTTVAEALAAEAAGADVIVAQGMEAGGHRGAFDATQAEIGMIGLFSLLPAIVDVVDVPVVATGGIADDRGVAAALLLGASAVQIGNRSPARSGGEDRERVGERDWTVETRRYNGDACLLRQARSQHSNLLCGCRRFTRSSRPCPLSYSTQPDSGDA